MKAIVVGCGRVGSSVAKKLTKVGWDVVAIDENEEALARLGDQWSGGFVVGHGMDVNVLREAGVGKGEGGGAGPHRGHTKNIRGPGAPKQPRDDGTGGRILLPAPARALYSPGLRLT